VYPPLSALHVRSACCMSLLGVEESVSGGLKSVNKRFEALLVTLSI